MNSMPVYHQNQSNDTPAQMITAERDLQEVETVGSYMSLNKQQATALRGGGRLYIMLNMYFVIQLCLMPKIDL